MTFDQARRKLKKIANGKYQSLAYEETYSADGTLSEINCRLYIDPRISETASTWKQAFKQLADRDKVIPLTTEGRPDEEKGVFLNEKTL